MVILNLQPQQIKLKDLSLGWEVFAVDGHDFEEIEKTINLARKSKYPSLIACKTKIGFGSPNFQGTSKVHGAPLGENEINLTRTNLNWEHPPFSYPNEALDAWKAISNNSKEIYNNWTDNINKSDLKKNFYDALNLSLSENYLVSSKILVKKLKRKTEKRH